MKKVAIIMGSDSDLPIAQKAVEELKKLAIPYAVHVISAHRTPNAAASFAQNAANNGFGVIIAIAGMAAHLGGVLAAYTVLPVIGVPCKGGAADGLDALLATVQMPSGVPVATVALGGGANAAILAAQILAVENPALTAKLQAQKQQMADTIAQKDAALQGNI
ncbi:5-(carboxyamino)imidazole ribonucleotide mutase [Ruminococcaceae bacterium OttesenSCG-928-A16]|nr:5-(carboxyamino)imidazole ribonucleotide mutase [Ruminococcaceae bacterium OttesenSCG-928-A16]